MTSLIYRVQDEEGRGPYRPGFSHVWKDEGHDERNPSFLIEFDIEILRMIPPGHSTGCGFRTLEQEDKWFSASERQKLRGLGYSLVQMSVDKVIAESDSQLVFTRAVPLRVGFVLVPWSHGLIQGVG